jgi:hypothetical protein
MLKEMDVKEKSTDIHNKLIWAILVYFVFYWSIKKDPNVMITKNKTFFTNSSSLGEKIIETKK